MSNQSCSCWPKPQPQKHQIWATSVTHAAGSLSRDWAKPGMESASSQRQHQDLNPLSHNRNSAKWIYIYIFNGCTHDIWKFPDSCGNTGSFNALHCARDWTCASKVTRAAGVVCLTHRTTAGTQDHPGFEAERPTYLEHPAVSEKLGCLVTLILGPDTRVHSWGGLSLGH